MCKKLVCVFLSILLILSAFAFCISAADDSLSFIVASDTHFRPAPKTVPVNFPGSKYYCADKTPNLLSESYAITREFLRQAAESDAEFILICGDLTHYGHIKEHTAMAQMLSDFEQTTGKRVYVIDGNHDFFNGVSRDRFKEVYADFGYSEALEIDDKSCSYTADLGGKYRLIAIDSIKYGEGEDGITQDLLTWCDKQAAQARADGKTPIAMMHHNFLEHIRFQSKILPAFITRPELEMKMRFLDWGVRYVFTGHQHGQDVTSFTDGADRTVYDIMTTSLNSYPCLFRSATLSDSGLDLKAHKIDRVDPSLLPDGYTPELLEEMTTDFNRYAYGCFRYAFELKKDDFISEDALEGTLNRFVGEKMSAFLDPFFRSFFKNIFLPIYTPSEPGGKCLADMARGLGLTVPQTQHATVVDLLFYFVSVYYAGDENLPYYDPQIVLFMRCVYTALSETMRDVNVQTRDALAADLRAAFRDEALPFAVSAAGKLALGAVQDDRLLEMTLLLISPLIESFSMDDEVADNDVFLPAKNAQKNPVLDFLIRVINWIARAFTRIPAGMHRIFTQYPLFSR